MKTYRFTREAKYIQIGFVDANSKEEALELIKNNDYDDISDIDWLLFYCCDCYCYL